MPFLVSEEYDLDADRSEESVTASAMESLGFRGKTPY